MTVRVDAAKNPQHYLFRAALTPRAGIALQLVSALVICVVASASLAQTSAPLSMSMPTASRVQSPGWWPTKGDAARDSYVGAAVCARCHASKAATQQKHAMARAAVHAPDAEILRQHDHLSFRLGPYREQIVTKGGKSVLTVTASGDAAPFSADLLWAFGVGHLGQTYVYERSGRYYESHLTFFASSQDLNITPGQSLATPRSLEDAAGRRMPPAESRACFACHTTASVTNNQLDVNSAVPGVTCEACHGPGASHVVAMNSGQQEQGADSIMNLSRLNPVESVDFCGACHRTWEDVVTNIGLGALNLRFAPYRLENSKCWSKPDARLTCVACHDPHQPLEHDPGAYDSRCLQCHVNQPGTKTTAEYPGAACPVSTRNCTTCHMPKVESPIQHSTFTDHWISKPLR
jgi:cytochrome c553